MIERFGKYEVLEKIAVGGFGEVYRGYDPVIKRNLAIKTCTARDDITRRRFELEAEISGNLHHRNIITIYDYGVQDDVPYLVEELLTGEDLDQKIKRGEPIPYERRILYLQQIARGLGYAHGKGVIHRDVKPGNVHILKDGTVKIMDFGIAQLQHQQSGLTATGQTIGTTAYLSPEQVRGETVDHRTDIFSFGALAYELITYRRAFQGETFSAVMYQILMEQPRRIEQQWPECPPDLVRLLDRCLEKEPDARFPDFGVIVEELKRLRGLTPETPIPALGAEPAINVPPEAPEPVLRPRPAPAAPGSKHPPPPKEEKGRRRPYALVALLAVALVAAAGWLAREPLGDFVGRLAGGGEETPAPEPEPTPPVPTPPATARFTVTSEPPGARVTLDGAPLEQPTPATVELEPGQRYDLQVTLDGYEPQGKVFMLSDLTEQQRSGGVLFFPLVERITPGRLVVRAPYPVALEIDGRSRAAARQHEVVLAPGTYRVAMLAPEVFYSGVRRVTLGEGERSTIEAPPAIAVNVAAAPSNCRISVDGRDLGFGPLNLELVAGPHEFTYAWQNPDRTITFTEEIGPDTNTVFRVAPTE